MAFKKTFYPIEPFINTNTAEKNSNPTFGIKTRNFFKNCVQDYAMSFK